MDNAKLMVSCIVPVFNGERYLAEAINSILAQTYRPLEVIVADDGSTDQTRKISVGFGDVVRYIMQANQGPSTARNLGIQAAAGEFIAFLDADDLWHAEKLTCQLERFQAKPELDYCVTHCQNFWIPELQAEAEKFRNHRISRPMPGYVTGTLVVRRVAFTKVGLFSTKLAHGDSTEWFLRAAEHGTKSELLPEVLMYRRIHLNNRSRLLATRSKDEFLRLLKSSLDRRRRSPIRDI
jgi:glycosyltransferase involved in cell wall biosynthesis